MALLISPLKGTFQVTTPYGVPNAYNGEAHYAIDWSAKEGTPVYAVADGKVVKSDKDDPLGGNIIKIVTSDGLIAGYAHLRDRYVSVGDTVKAGTIIGAVGKTGDATTGAHLHFSLERGSGQFVNPLDYLDALDIHDYASKLCRNITGVIRPTVDVDGTCAAGFQPFNFADFNPLGGSYLAETKPEDIPVVGGAVAAVLSIPEFLGTLGGFLFDANNWIRLGALTGGVILLGAGSIMVYRAT